MLVIKRFNSVMDSFYILRNISAAVLVISLLAACDGQNARDILGLGKRSPDEFRVVSRPPLSTPPDFTLRPPQKNKTPRQSAADLQARALVTGTAPLEANYDYERFMGAAETAVGVVHQYELESSADSQFLHNLGADNYDPDIRSKLSADAAEADAAHKQATSGYLFDWLIPKKSEEVIVDAKAEKARIEENKANNKPITEGETPIIEPKQKGILEDLL